MANELHHYIETLLPSGRTITLEQFELFAERAVHPNALEHFSRTLRRDMPRLQQLARSSYRHENGFFKLLMAEDENTAFKFRLHFWPMDRATLKNSENIHSHRFSCYSYVIAGALINQEWVLDSVGDLFHHFRYTPRMRSQSYTLEYCGQQMLMAKSQNQIHDGTGYHMHADYLHTSLPATGHDVVTFFATEKQGLRDFADVYTKRYDAQNTSIKSPSLSPAEYLEVLDRIVSVIRKKGRQA